MNDPRLKLDKFNIIRELVGGHITYYDEDNIVYHDGQTPPTDEEISAKRAAKQAEWDSKEYARNREFAYHPIGDQLDDLYHQGAFSDEMAAKLKKVKDDNPK